MMEKGILLVDDDEDILIILKKILEEEGYTTHIAHNIEKAKSLIEDHEVHLVIMDYFIQGIDGIETAEALINLDDGLKIVFLSGYHPVLDAVYGLGFKVDRVLLKPVEVERLLWEVRCLFSEYEGSR
jgi:DNA-binding response OmpR family regulator